MQDWRPRKVLSSGAHSRDPVALHTPAVQPRDDALSRARFDFRWEDQLDWRISPTGPRQARPDDSLRRNPPLVLHENGG
jgi:thiamine biosynthesis protein ThiC